MKFLYVSFLFFVIACQQPNALLVVKDQRPLPAKTPASGIRRSAADTISPIATASEKSELAYLDYDNTLWTEVIALIPDAVVDLKYATKDNFVGTQMYDCARCFLRPSVAKALVKVQAELKKKGYGIILYDCYRPRPVQQKLWDKVPDDNYVTPPWKGSMHNRGMAVDIGLIDALGNVIDMGTGFDDLSVKSHHTELNFPKVILDHRLLLKNTMERHGFGHIRTEWWHYSFKGKQWLLADWLWPCLK